MTLPWSRKKETMEKETRKRAPLSVAYGFVETDDKKAAIAVAKGYIFKRIDALSICYYAVARFDTGYLWEIHEGGAGVSYLPSVVRLLAENPGSKVWVPCGERVFEILLRGNKPLCLLLPAAQGEYAVKNGIQAEEKGKMSRYENRGLVLFSVGLTVFLASAALCAATGAGVWNARIPSIVDRPLKLQSAPHFQWKNLSGLAEQGLYVDKLEYQAGKWSIITKKFPEPVDENEPISLGDTSNNGATEHDGVEARASGPATLSVPEQVEANTPGIVGGME
ncbi:hypothetical protein ACFOY8_13155 [Thalassospira xianhensis]|nr:hypothetical protein [Thalassospira xianhensis]